MTHTDAFPFSFAHNHKAVVTSLENLPRTGWLQWHIENPENVWEHIVATRKLAIAYKSQMMLDEHDFQELLDMIEIHDWPEALVGDGVILGDEPNVDELRCEKKTREFEAMKRICANTQDGDRILSLYTRYHNGSDHVARLVKQLEKLQAVIKACEYEQTQHKKGLTEEFVYYTKDLITEPFLILEFKNIAATIVMLVLILYPSSPFLLHLQTM